MTTASCRRPPRELLDLDRLVERDAVRAQPAAGVDGTLPHGVVADPADVGLRVDDERRLLPRLELPRGHRQQRPAGRCDRRRTDAASRSCALRPRSRTSSEVHELDRWIAIESGSQQIVQLTERADEGRMVVTAARRRRGVRARVSGAVRPAPCPVENPAGRRTFGCVSGSESCTRNATRSPAFAAASSVALQTGARSRRPGCCCTCRQSQRM